MEMIHQYLFWLIFCGSICFCLERLLPWRPTQKTIRPQVFQDTILYFLNGHVVSMILSIPTAWTVVQLVNLLLRVNLPDPRTLKLFASIPIVLQFVLFFLLKDLIEWGIHNLLHRVPFLWHIHRHHHSITTMDWLGNFRFHYLEIVVYRTISWLPLALLGVDQAILLPIAVVSTLIGNLNHTNLRLSWGPLRYILNSPRMHIWHHDVICHKKSGQNFAIVFSIWDWLFCTAWYPRDTECPEALGFEGIEHFPAKQPLLFYLLYPFWTPGRSQPKEML